MKGKKNILFSKAFDASVNRLSTSSDYGKPGFDQNKAIFKIMYKLLGVHTNRKFLKVHPPRPCLSSNIVFDIGK